MIRRAVGHSMRSMPSRSRTSLVGACAAACVIAVVAVSPSLAASGRTHVIKAQDIAFTPEHVTIHRGDRVTWKFLDAKLLSPHTVTSIGARRFHDSPTGRLTGSFTVTFAKRGIYRFECTIHPATMSGGVITVK
jgi:plastocyanin